MARGSQTGTGGLKGRQTGMRHQTGTGGLVRYRPGGGAVWRLPAQAPTQHYQAALNRAAWLRNAEIFRSRFEEKTVERALVHAHARWSRRRWLGPDEVAHEDGADGEIGSDSAGEPAQARGGVLGKKCLVPLQSFDAKPCAAAGDARHDAFAPRRDRRRRIGKMIIRYENWVT